MCFTDRPGIIVHPHDVTKPKGSNVILSCNATGNPEPKISWTKDGFSSNLYNNSRISFSQEHKKMTIANVTMKDRGKYECTATNNIGKDISNAALVEIQCKYSMMFRHNLLDLQLAPPSIEHCVQEAKTLKAVTILGIIMFSWTWAY